jgi:NADH dehydrogenase
VHISAIGADENSPSHYGRSKAQAEKLVLAAQPQAVIMRPSILFGPEDDFFNRFAGLARMSPFLPLIGGGKTRFQPVFVGDVAAAIADAVDGKLRGGTTYELGGPEVRTFKQLMQYVLDTTERKRLLLPIPFFAAKLPAMIMQLMPKPMLTPDQVELLRADNVVSDAAIAERRTLQGIGIEPDSIEAIVPSYLWRFRKTGQFRSRPA